MTKYKGIKTLEVLEGADNYNHWISNRIKKYIFSPALEIGAGTGNISTSFTNLEDLVVTDIDSTLVEKLKKRFKGNKNIRVEDLDISTKLSNIKNKFNSIYSVNVLEHIKNDEIAIQNMYRLLNNHGKVVILVPAKRFAYKKIDKRLGHFRRYEKEDLTEKLKKAGFKIVEVEYFNFVGLLSWLIRDKITKKHNYLNPSHVKMFDLLVPVLRMIEPRKNLPIGISLIAIGEK